MWPVMCYQWLQYDLTFYLFQKDGSIKVVPVIGVCGEIDLNSFVLNKHEVSY